MPAVHPLLPKQSRAHEFIDRRSLALDRAIAQVRRAQPDLLGHAKTTLERWIQQRQPFVPPVSLEWQEILNHWPLEKTLELLTSAEEQPTRLRQSSPFCGILSAQERLAIFKEYESSRARAKEIGLWVWRRQDGSAGRFMKSPSTRAFTLTELLVTVVVLALVAAVLLPALPRARERARRSTCAGLLMEIGITFKTWAVERTNDFPMQVSARRGGTLELAGAGLAFRHFQVLSNELSTPRVLTCPADKRAAAKDFASLANTNVSYFVGLEAQEACPQMLMAGDRNVTNGIPLPPNGILVLATNTQAGWTHELHNCQGNVLLADSSVQQVNSPALRRALAQSGVTNRLAIP